MLTLLTAFFLVGPLSKLGGRGHWLLCDASRQASNVTRTVLILPFSMWLQLAVGQGGATDVRHSSLAYVVLDRGVSIAVPASPLPDEFAVASVHRSQPLLRPPWHSPSEQCKSNCARLSTCPDLLATFHHDHPGCRNHLVRGKLRPLRRSTEAACENTRRVSQSGS